MSVYPESFDSDTNLYLVRDKLKLRLLVDYNPGDEEIFVDDLEIFSKFPPTGILTLTDFCSDTSYKAISFRYFQKTNNSFTQLERLEETPDSFKPKRDTFVTLNVMSEHHNSLVDALINIQKFSGTKNSLGKNPLVGTMDERINFLRNLVLKPKAWFKVENNYGIAPLKIMITDLSLRSPTYYKYDFGDGTFEEFNFNVIPGQTEGTSIIPSARANTQKIYQNPGVYTIKLTVKNNFGEDTISFVNHITVKNAAPDNAEIEFVPSTNQELIGGKLRTKISNDVNIRVIDTGQDLGDSIKKITWNTGNGVTLEGASINASYDVGGVYDINLRIESQLGGFRITNFTDVVDVLEKRNIWLATQTSFSGTNKQINVYEYNIFANLFKSETSNTLNVTKNDGFLTGLPNEQQQKAEFRKNNGFVNKSNISSGDNGNSLLFWAEGASSDYGSQLIKFSDYNPFTRLFSTVPNSVHIERNWNWLSINGSNDLYFILGTKYGPPNANTDLDSYKLSKQTLTNEKIKLNSDDFINGAGELRQHIGDGTIDGEFCVYRGCYHDGNGYFLRNDNVGQFFRIKSFYKTNAEFGNPIGKITKLPDLPSSLKLEGELVSLLSGVYFFYNSGEINYYNPLTNIWTSGSPSNGVNSFFSITDKTVNNYSDPKNTLIVTSDDNRYAYLSYDYSRDSFIRYDETNSVFEKLTSRPNHPQFAICCY